MAVWVRLRRSVAHLALAVGLLSGCGMVRIRRVADDALRIALIAPTSGDYQRLGQAARNGAALAVETWNQSGGVAGTPIQLVVIDGECDGDAARRAAQTAIQDQGIRYIVGGVCGGESEGIAQVVDEADALQISPAAVAADLTLDAEGNVRSRVFRAPFVDADQGLAAAQFAIGRLNARRAGILYDEDSAYARVLVEAFQTAFVAGGGEVVETATYDRETQLFFDALDRVRAEAPDVLYMPGYHNVAATAIPQARTFGMAQPVIGSDGWDSPDLPLDAVGNSYFTTHFYGAEPSDAIRMWVNAYSQRYLTPPDALATLSYDAVDMLLEAITQAGSLDPVLVAAAMETTPFDAVSGSIQFDATHNPIKGVVILQVQDGRLRFVERLQPRQLEP